MIIERKTNLEVPSTLDAVRLQGTPLAGRRPAEGDVIQGTLFPDIKDPPDIKRSASGAIQRSVAPRRPPEASIDPSTFDYSTELPGYIVDRINLIKISKLCPSVLEPPH
jgi:hypothetical protein